MRKKNAIQNFVASLLLLVGLLSALPKSFFHDVVANHTDTISCPYNDCVHAEGFHCGFIDQVVTSPFETVSLSFVVSAPVFGAPVSASFFPRLLSKRFGCAEGRGPPFGV